MSQDDSLKLGGSARRRDSCARITNQQKMKATAHFQANKGMTQAGDFVNFPWIVNIVVLPEWFSKFEDLLYCIREGLRIERRTPPYNVFEIFQSHR